MEMILTDRELRTVESVFGELAKMPYDELNKFLGSLTIKEMIEIYMKLSYREYCERRGMDYEDMAEEDFVEAACEKYGV